MRAAITIMSEPKSEHVPKDSAAVDGNEDAAAYDAARGIFAIADGVTAASFSKEWAQYLVSRAVRDIPLLSADPYEVEWWLADAVANYVAPEIPSGGDPILRYRAERGAASTLATVRFTAVADVAAAAELLAIGDSCVFIEGNEPGSPTAWRCHPITGANGFGWRPHSLVSVAPDVWEPIEHVSPLQVTLHAGTTMYLVTDAVAHWVWNAVESGTGVHSALRQLGNQQLATWRDFVAKQRATKRLADDDSTVMIVRLSSEEDAPSDAEPLGVTDRLPLAVRQERQRRLEVALREDNPLDVVRLVGDPAHSGMAENWATNVLQAYRDRATALAKALRAVLRAVNAPLVDRAVVQQVWRTHSAVLTAEASARPLHTALVRDGFVLPDGTPTRG